MIRLILIVACGLMIFACAPSSESGGAPAQDPKVLQEKAHAAFLQRSIVKEFASAGISIDCDYKFCANIPEASLLILKKFKPSFLRRKDRMPSISIGDEKTPHYDYRLHAIYLHSSVTETQLSEFFSVLYSIDEIETLVGMRIEFPNTAQVKSSIEPLLQILSGNSRLLIAGAKHIDTLVVSSVFNQYWPGEKILVIKISDMRTSFADLWTFFTPFFRAQELFGNISFRYNYGDAVSPLMMDLMFKNASRFTPVFAQLQGLEVAFIDWKFFGYADQQGLLNSSLYVSNSFTEAYLETVFETQARIRGISKHIGLSLRHSDSMIELASSEKCLNKVDFIKDAIKAKVAFIDVLELAGPSSPSYYVNSSYADRKLFLSCNQTVTKLKAVVDAIR